jgi:palmitoyl-protein thioesterase
MDGMIFNPVVQNTLGPAGYFRSPENLDEYKSKSSFLPKLNNEVDQGSADYNRHKDSMKALNALMLVMFDKDQVIFPRESQLFG